MKAYTILLIFLIIILAVYLQYEGFDPSNAGYSAPATKEYADTFGFDRLRERSRQENSKNPVFYYIQPVQTTFYYSIAFLLVCTVSMHVIFNLDSNLMAYVYFSIITGSIVQYMYTYYANFKNGMYRELPY